jgi:hypothetical protein
MKLFHGFLMISTFHKFCSDDQFKEDEVRGNRDTHGGEEKWVEIFFGRT